MNDSFYLQSHTYANGQKQKSLLITGQTLMEIDKGFPQNQEQFKTFYLNWDNKQRNF